MRTSLINTRVLFVACLLGDLLAGILVIIGDLSGQVTDSPWRHTAIVTRNGIRPATDDHTIHPVMEGAAHQKAVQNRELKRRHRQENPRILRARLKDGALKPMKNHRFAVKSIFFRALPWRP